MIKLKKLVEDLIPGGLSDNKSIQDIADKHQMEVSEVQRQVEMGIEVEMEHTVDQQKAEEIALDHLWEIGDYYTRLDQMERSATQEND